MYFVNTVLKRKTDKASAKSHLKNLIALANADGHLAEIEEHLLLAVTRSLGLDEKDLYEIQANPDDILFVLPESYEEKIDQFNDLLMLISVDGHIDKEEMKICWSLAQKYELPVREVEKIISKYL